MDRISSKSNWLTPAYHRPAIATAALVALGVGGVSYAAGLSLRSCLLLTPSTGLLLYGGWRRLCQTPPPPPAKTPESEKPSVEELQKRRDIFALFRHQLGDLRLSFLSALLQTMGEEKFRFLVSVRHPQKTIILPFLTDRLVEELGTRSPCQAEFSSAEARRILRSGVYEERIPLRHLMIAYLVGPGSTMEPDLFEEFYGFKTTKEEIAAANALFQPPVAEEEGWSPEAMDLLARYSAPKAQFEKEEKIAAVVGFALVSVWAASCYWRAGDPFFSNETFNFGVGFLLWIAPVGFVQWGRKPVNDSVLWGRLLAFLPEAPIASAPFMSREERKPLNRASLIAWGRPYGCYDPFPEKGVERQFQFATNKACFSKWSPDGTISSLAATELLRSKGLSVDLCSQGSIRVTTFLNVEKLLTVSSKWGLCSYLRRESSIDRIRERLNYHDLKVPYPDQLEEAIHLIQTSVTPDDYLTMPQELNGLSSDQMGRLRREWEMATELGREHLADRFGQLVLAHWGLIAEDAPLFTQAEVESFLNQPGVTSPTSEDAAILAEAIIWWPEGINQEEWRDRLYHPLSPGVWDEALRLTPVRNQQLFLRRRMGGRSIMWLSQREGLAAN